MAEGMPLESDCIVPEKGVMNEGSLKEMHTNGKAKLGQLTWCMNINKELMKDATFHEKLKANDV